MGGTLREADNSGDLDDGKDEFCFPVAFDAEEVDDDDEDKEDGDKGVVVDGAVVPEVDCVGCCDDLEGENDEPL